jgi:hypothetical protein
MALIPPPSPSLKIQNSKSQPNYSPYYSPIFYFQTQLNLQYVYLCPVFDKAFPFS